MRRSARLSASSSRSRSVTLAFLALPIVGIFVHTSPGKLLDQLSNPVVKDAFVVTLKTSVHRAGADPALRDADRVPARHPALPGPLARGHARRAAARAAAGGRRASACSPRSAASACSARRLNAFGIDAPVHPDRGHRRRRVRRQPALHPPGDRDLRGDRSAPDRGLAHARRRRRCARSSAWSLPLARGGLIAGLALSFARGLGEFGATIMFAGSLQGVTQTLPLAIYQRVRHQLRRGPGDERRARPDQRRPPPDAQNRTLMATLTLDQVTVPLRDFELELSLEVDSTVALVGPSGAGQEHRPERDRRAREAGRRLDRAATTRPGSTPSAGVVPAARGAAGRARLPGLRALPAPDRAPERRVRRAASAADELPRPLRDRAPRRARTPATSPAASGSASRSPARSRAIPRSCCSTSRWRRSTPHTKIDVRAELQQLLAGLEIPTLLVTHDFEDAAALADRVGVHRRGPAPADAAPPPISSPQPADPFVASFTGANLLPHPAGRRHRDRDAATTPTARPSSRSIPGTSPSRPPIRTTPP